MSQFVLNSSGDGIAAPLDASYYKGQGLRQGLEREFVVIMNESVSEDNRMPVCKHTSGQLQRTGCLQRYAARDRKGP